MVINKKILLIFISITLITTISSMEKKSDHTTTTEVLSNLLNFETDSLVIARGKTILDNKDYNDKPLLLAVYSYLMTELAICKFSEQKYYTMLVETQAIRISEDVEYIERLLFEQLDDSWKKQKKEILQVNNLKKAVKMIEKDVVSCFELESIDTKINIAVYKKWMKTREFVSTKFLIDVICKLMGEKDSIEQEQDKILELIKKYDNQ